MKHTSTIVLHVGAATLGMALALGLAGCGQQPAPGGQAQADKPSAAQTAPEKKSGYTLRAKGLSVPDGTPVQLSTFARDDQGKWSLRTVAKTRIEGGRFTLHGPSMELPLPAELRVGDPKSRDFADSGLILGNAEYQVRETDGVLTVQGGHYNDLVFGYTREPEYIAAVATRDKAERKAYAGIDPDDEKALLKAKMEAVSTIGPLYAATGKIQADYLAGLIEGHDDDMLKFYALSIDPDNKRYPPQKRATMMAGFADTLADNPAYQKAQAGAAFEAKQEATRESLSKGNAYRDLVVADKDGHKVRLSDVLKNNQLVLLDFWASWCAPCREEFPFLAKVYHDYHAAGFEIYAVSLDEERGDWLKALKQESDNGHVPWINLRAEGFGSEVAKKYGVMGLPNNYLISGDGTIVGVDMRKQDVEKAVTAQLKKRDHTGS